jgi:Na+/melibiose symporter-like transporter
MIILHIIHLVIIIIIIFNVKMNFHAIGEEEGAERTTHAKEFKHMQQKSQYMFENKYWLANSFSFLFQLFFNLKNTDSPKNPHRMMDRY